MRNTVPVVVRAREALDCDFLAIACFSGENPETAGLGETWSAAAARAAARPGWRGHEGQSAETGVETGGEAGPAAVALHGLGEPRKLTARKLAAWLAKAAAAVEAN